MKQRAWIVLAAGLAVGWTLSAPVWADASLAATSHVTTNKERALAYLKSDLPSDPAARYGQLANGFTYVIYKNKAVPGTAAVRMRVDVGSINEAANEQGAAHFVEHMAFEGSTHMAAGDMVKVLQRNGLTFGRDTNAFTNVSSTFYQLDLPKTEPAVVETALSLMEETSQNLIFDPAAVERQRPVILSEMRSRDTAVQRAGYARLKATLDGQAYINHLTIGTTDSVSTLSADALHRFYNRYYRPENTTLVIVGDVDPDAVEAMIKAHFAGWTAKGPAPAPVDYGAYKPKGTIVRDYSEAGVPNLLTLGWYRPYKEGVQTADMLREAMLDATLERILSKRLGLSRSQDNVLYVNIGISLESYLHTARGFSITMEPKPGEQASAALKAYGVLAQFAAYGDQDLYQEDADEALGQLNVVLEKNALAKDSVPNASQALRILTAIDYGQVVVSPEDALKIFQDYRPQITLTALKNRLNAWLADDGPIVFYRGAKPTEIDEATFKRQLDAFKILPLPKPVALQKPDWPYTDFGTPSALVSRVDNPALGFTRLTYANGLIVNVKPTALARNQVLVRVRLWNGQARLSPDVTVPPLLTFFYNKNTLTRGGLQKLGAVQLTSALSDKIYALDYRLGDNYTDLQGATTPGDLTTQMQLLMAYIKDAKFDPSAYQFTTLTYSNEYRAVESSAEALVGADTWLFPKDKRYAIPTPEDVKFITADDFRALMSSTLNNAPVEITIVGDVTVDQAQKQIDKTFAALPALPKAPSGTVTDPVFTTEKHIVVTHEGLPGQAAAAVVWKTDNFYSDPQRARALSLLSAILNLRLTDVVREKDGLAYSPSAAYVAWDGYSNTALIRVRAGITPANEKPFFDAMDAIVKDLQARPVSADELARARNPMIESFITAQKTNAYWLNAISGISFEPDKQATLLNRIDQLNKVTPADIQKLARTYLIDANAIEIAARPNPLAPPPPIPVPPIPVAPVPGSTPVVVTGSAGN